MRKLSELTEEEKMELYREIVKNWGKVSPKLLAEKLDVKIWALGAVVSKLRRKGIDLPKMTMSFLDESFVDELKQLYATRG
jgi:hypothetical protein